MNRGYRRGIISFYILYLCLCGCRVSSERAPEAQQETTYLRVEGSKFLFGNSEVYLSGANLPWISYGNDFGNAQPNGIACALQDYVSNVSASGGNSIRVWLFVEGDSIPLWDPTATGEVVGTDMNGTLIHDVQRFVDFAASKNVLVTMCLWNGALMRNENAIVMIRDAAKTQSFIDHALTPLVTGLASRNGLGAWEVMNEPEGSLLVASDEEPCYDTSNLEGTGAGWANTGLAMKDILRFTNQVSDAIQRADPKALVTVGAWSEWSITSAEGVASMAAEFGGSAGSQARAIASAPSPRNYYSDECLVKAGGLANGTLSFVQVHSYAWNGEYSAASPFSVPANYYYDIEKPILIGEFASVDCQERDRESNGGSEGTGCSVEEHYSWGLAQGYAGTWDWAMIGGDGVDDGALCVRGMSALKNDSSVRAVKLEPSIADDDDNTCGCSDVPPDDQYSCAEQAAWGKCEEDFMAGFCCMSCFACSKDPPCP
jgi:mannan endo-1,4-beta-mannosidase